MDNNVEDYVPEREILVERNKRFVDVFYGFALGILVAIIFALIFIPFP